jgi:hypothetical protein
MKKCSSVSRQQIFLGASALLFIGIIHRVLQLWLLWPQLAISIMQTTNNQMMQLLPQAMMQEHPWWGVWFLQQAPPIPNVMWAGALALFSAPFNLAIALILLNALFSSLTAVLMALLFYRVGANWWLGLLLSMLFLLGGDLLLLEYHTMGQFFYETLTMLLCVLSCHCALSLVRSGDRRFALYLGLCVAALALSRASFSLFWPVVLLWLCAVGFWRRPLVLAAFLLPVLLLHGGWSVKNYWVHGYWSWSTSSWGGANIQRGERTRNGLMFNEWMALQPPICPSPWHELTVKPPFYFGLIPESWGNDLPAQVAERDRYIAEKRGHSADLDSVAAREWSKCLVKEFLYYWQDHPELLIGGTWRSYQVFWLPIRQFSVTQPFPLWPRMDAYAEGIHWSRSLRDAWSEWGGDYSIRQVPIAFELPNVSDYAPVTIIALPFFFSAISALNFALLHSLPLLIACLWYWKVEARWPRGCSFFLLIYCYLAGFTSVVEYGENMRFRIEVEPIIWVMSILIASRWWVLVRFAVQRAKS